MAIAPRLFLSPDALLDRLHAGVEKARGKSPGKVVAAADGEILFELDLEDLVPLLEDARSLRRIVDVIEGSLRGAARDVLGEFIRREQR